MKPNGQSSGFGGQPWGWRDAALCAGLAVLAVFFLNASWRKWPDPLVDFGRELYLPWRITQGGVLYRDMDHVYGPFSSYFNSLVFRVGGVGMSSLIAANLVIYAAILGLLYFLVRAGWGRGVAFVSGAIFVGVFSFSHLLGTGNYNYMTPYAHETTHGMLVVLLLILALRSCLERSARWKLVLAGLLAGVTLLIKPEVILAAGALAGGAIWLSCRRHGGRWLTWKRAGNAFCFLVGCVLPVTGAVLGFKQAAGLAWGNALRCANYAWISVFVNLNFKNDPLQKSLLGTDQLGTNLMSEAVGGAMALAAGIGLALACPRFLRLGMPGKLVWGLIAVAMGVALVPRLPWLDAAAALPVLLIFTAGVHVRRHGRTDGANWADRGAATRVFLWLAAASLLTRMAFNPRIEHYGFFQAALAAMMGVAAMLVTVPEAVRSEPAARRCYQILMRILILAGGGMIAGQSLRLLALRTQPVGKGSDLFYAFDQSIDPTGLMMEKLRDYFTTRDSGARSLMVLPDGVMLNYLTRLPSPVPQYTFFPGLLENGQEETTVKRLTAAPPDRVVLISRDMREFGAERFGDAVGHGKLLLDFVERNYERVVVLGGDPLDYRQHGAWVYARKPGN